MLAGTIVASNFAAMALTLADTFLQHHPDARFAILVVDDRPVDVPGDRVEVLRLDDVVDDANELDAMRTIYDVREFCTAVKPSLLRTLLARDPVVCYLDPDIRVYAPFDEIVERAGSAGIVLTPHVLRPVPRDGRDVSERTLSLTGMFNLGFIALGRTATPFLDWWHERLVTDAVIDLENGLFTDQKWVDWVTVLFPHEVTRDPGMNVAWWNLHERPLRLVDGEPFVDGDPVRFIHFSGYDPSIPDRFCKWEPRPRTSFEVGTAIRTLADAYGDRLAGVGHLHRRLEPYRWGVSADGVELTPEIRSAWRTDLLDHLASGGEIDSGPAPAFGPRSDGFRPWLEAVGGGTDDWPHARVERMVWERRPDLQDAFPDIDGADAEAFRNWLDFEPDAWRELEGYAPTCADRDRPRPQPPGTPQPEAETPRRLVGRAFGVGRRLRTAAVGAARRGEVPSPEPDAIRPLAFLHVPKCGGNSLHQALAAALPEHRWAPWTIDPSQFGPLADAPLTDAMRATAIPSPNALLDFDAAMGHYSLTTLMAGFSPDDIVTVLREPRSRLLSHYEFWRNVSAKRLEELDPWAPAIRTATQHSFGDWLLDEFVAYQTDNLFVRQLAPDHPAIPATTFIDAADVDELVEVGIERLDSLGWIDVLERGSDMWTGLSRRVGVELMPKRANVTGRDVAPAGTAELKLDDAGERALAERTCIDAQLWAWVAAKRGVESPTAVADAAWHERLAEASES